ncbi:hypothetical protein Hbl1158_02890 [Halobaculum sp. CBA1158]|nr:hypothetical protein [Halobaculum sp. CBA1158]UIP00333.1 hypothetical protein Hbl1158_02890 [Halobaculum sp. CBA1158]
MAAAATLGMAPAQVREELTWREIEQLLVCLPGIERLRLLALGGDPE